MFPAVFTRTYPFRTASEVFVACREDGFGGVQFNLSSAGLETVPEVVPEHLADEIRLSAAAEGIEICAVSATYNMAHPDPAYRRKMRARLVDVVAIAGCFGSPVVTVCSGSRDASNMWKAHPDNASAAAWSDFRADLDAALDLAAVAGLRIGIEPEPANIILDARTARRLLNDVGSDRLGIVLDAANICAGRSASERRDALMEAFDLLADDIVLAHAKDIDADGRVVPPGSGIVDLRLFVRKLAEAGYDRGLIGHGFDYADARLAAHRLGELCGGSHE